MTRSSRKDFISIILVAPYDITRRARGNSDFDFTEKSQYFMGKHNYKKYANYLESDTVPNIMWQFP